MCVHVFSLITPGRGKSFHFLDESLVNQEPRDLLLPLCSASLFLSHLPPSFSPYLFYPSSPQTFAINSPSITFFHFSLPHLSILAFSPFAPSCVVFHLLPNHLSISALQPFISLTLPPPLPIPTSAVAESAFPFCSPLQTHKCAALHFHALA